MIFYAGYSGSSGDEGTTSSYKHKLTSAEARFNTAVYGSWFSSTSDDRLKDNEELIESACETLSKLRPQTYDKKPSIESDDPTTWIKESGLIAQEVYYDAPELRHYANEIKKLMKKAIPYLKYQHQSIHNKIQIIQVGVTNQHY